MHIFSSKVAVLGPLGALSIIPMVLIYLGCEHFAKKRQIRYEINLWNLKFSKIEFYMQKNYPPQNFRRIEKLWMDQRDVSVDSEKVKYLLEQ
jgi:hypothetical protein